MGWIARCTTWCAACGGYLLFAGVANSRNELITAAVLATGAAAWTWAIRRCGHLRFSFLPSHAIEWAKAVVALGPAIAKTFPIFVEGALLGRSRGGLLEISFRRGAEGGARDAARRASAILIASFGPDNFVVRAPPKKDRVLMHAILPQNASRDPEWLNS
ncbi:MAG TPA: hypothetical protein VJ862_09870 [Rhodanobacteraceae bacterium]|nr:hypothetical protein [Rhodanobacteraceae bacterium]